MTRTLPRRGRSRRPAGFTLIELLVVLTIVVLVSAVTLPTVLPALNHRQVGEAARILQAALAGARDAAIRDNAPRGIRLLLDPVFNGLDPSTKTYSPSAPLAYNRFIPLETADDYTTGRILITFPPTTNYTPYVESLVASPNTHPALRVDEALFDASSGFPNERTSWFWNIRIGDKIRFNDSGRFYTVVGPAVINPNNPATPGQNPELFVNDGPPSATPLHANPPSPVTVAGATVYPEYLYLVNGQDDNLDGFVDNGWDGFDNNYNKLVDEYIEWEQEQWVGTELTNLLLLTPDVNGNRTLQNQSYTIMRRPVPAPGAREVTLPGGVVIDATTGFPGLTYERSRLPIDPKALYVDILVNSNGQVVPTTEYSSPTASTGFPFFHFWLTERQDVHQASDLWGFNSSNTPPSPNPNPNSGSSFLLPLPESYYAGLTTKPAVALEGERTLLTLFTRTGQITSNSIENFSVTNTNAPFYQAQLGTRESK